MKKRALEEKSRLEIYTDGSCSPNPGPGGYAALLRFMDDKRGEVILRGHERHTTNNIMELRAVIEALNYVVSEQLYTDYVMDVYTDSKYVKLGITEWITTWKRKDWKNSQNKVVKNLELWKTLDRLNSTLIKHNIVWNWIKGHKGHEHNERVDALAKEETQKAVLDKEAFYKSTTINLGQLFSIFNKKPKK